MISFALLFNLVIFHMDNNFLVGFQSRHLNVTHICLHLEFGAFLYTTIMDVCEKRTIPFHLSNGAMKI